MRARLTGIRVTACFFIIISQRHNDFLDCHSHNSGPHFDKCNNRVERPIKSLESRLDTETFVIVKNGDREPSTGKRLLGLIKWQAGGRNPKTQAEIQKTR